ncbi:MAG TPA: hypothetical protein VGF52_05755, partial [Tepidisphaeraceae bacterium]
MKQLLVKIVASTRKIVEVLGNMKGADFTLDKSMESWTKSLSDYRDAVLVATSDFMGITQMLSDDCDMVTHEGLTVFTANYNTI